MFRLAPPTVLLLFALAGAVLSQPALVQIKHDASVQAVAWSGDGKRLATAAEDGRIRVCEFPSGKEVASLNNGAAVTAVVFSPDGKQLGIKNAQDGPLSVWDLGAGKKLKQLAFKGYTCPHLAFTPDGQTLVAAGPGEKMVWNHVKGNGSGSKSGLMALVGSSAVSADGAIAAWSDAQGVNLFHTTPSRQVRMQTGPLLAFVFSPDARFLAASSGDKTIRLWAVEGAEVRKFEGLRDPARLMHFSANGKVLAAASPGDPVVRLWDVGSARLRRRLTTNPLDVRALALSPDGFQLALASGTQVHVWNVATRDLGDLGEPKALSAAELKDAWEDLASTDSTKAEAAFRQLAQARQHALDFLQTQVRPIASPPVDWKRAEQFIQELDHPTYQTRQRASLELIKLGELIQPALHKYLAAKPQLEGQRRATKLLERMTEVELTPDRRRCVETIEILEIWQSPQARAMLEELAQGALIAQIRLAAREALERFQRSKGKGDVPDKKPV